MTAVLPPRTIVAVGSRLGRIVKESRCGNAHGYDVLYDREDGTNGYAPHFVAVGSARPAQLGVNVCRSVRGKCFCGLLHVAQRELDEIATDAPPEGINLQQQEQAA